MPSLCQGLLGRYICHQLCYPISAAIDVLAEEVICLYITFSATLERIGSKEIGLWFDGFAESPDLGIGITSASFQASENAF